MAGNQYKQFLRRLEALEKILSPAPLMVKAKLPDGTITEMTMRECIKKDCEFIKVVGGRDLNDLDALLREIEKRARHEQDNISE